MGKKKKKLISLEFVLENTEGIEFKLSDIERFSISDSRLEQNYFDGKLFRYIGPGKLFIEIKKEANAYDRCRTFDKMLPFNRFIECADIVLVVMKYSNGTTKEINLLYLEEGQHADINKAQRNTLLDNGNLQISINWYREE